MSNPPKPIEVKRRQGNPGKRPLPRLAHTAPLAPLRDTPVPIALGPAGRDLWRRSCESGYWLSVLDLTSLQDLCTVWDEITELRNFISKIGMVIEEPIVTPTGSIVGDRLLANPLLKELRAAQKLLHSTASALGFTPTARARLGLAEVKTQSVLEDLFRRRDGEGGDVIDIAPDT